MKAKLLALLAGVCALLVNCVAANALTFTTAPQHFEIVTSPQVNFDGTAEEFKDSTAQGNFDETNSTQPPVLRFEKFDTTLGTLTGVKIILESSYNGDASLAVTRTDEEGPLTFLAIATIDLSLTGDLIADQNSQKTFSASCDADSLDSCTGSGSLTMGNDFDAMLSGLPLVPFIGPGTFDLTATLKAALAPRIDNGTIPVDLEEIPDNITLSGILDNSTWEGKVTVEYTYVPFATAVPEPLSLYLLLGGLGGIALSRRRRR